MKKPICLLAAMIFSLSLFGCDYPGSSKVGVVDMNVLMKDSVPGKSAQKFIEAQENELQAAFESIQQKLEKNPDNEKVLQEMQQVYAASQQKIQTIGQNVVAKLFDGIQGSLQNFRQKNGYAYLLRAEALEVFDPSLDVTQAVLAEVNRLNLDFSDATGTQGVEQDAAKAAPTPENK